MAVPAKVVSVWLLIASASYVFCLPKREVMNEVGHEVVTTPNPNNQTHTEANGGPSEDVQLATPTPNPQNQTAAAQTEVTEDGASEYAVHIPTFLQSMIPTPYPQNQTTIAQTENADGLSEDDVVTATANPQNQTTAQTGNADGLSEDNDMVTAAPILQNLTSSTTGGATDAEVFARSMVRLSSNITEIVNKHNTLRRGVRPTASNMLKMSWNNEAAVNAQRWADTCSLTHSKPGERTISTGDCGENLYIASYRNSWSNAIQSWYDEVKDFKYGVGSINGAIVGHYTQVVSYRSNQLGCAMANCSKLKYYFYVCQYCPPRMTSQQTMPYKSGPSCGDCPNACEDKLCTNPCPYVDQYTNCPELKQQWGCNHDAVASWCPASCRCTSQIV